MVSFNKVILLGNLTKDPELRYNGDKAICSFSLAVNDRNKTGENKADFFDIIAWEKQAENCNTYLQKGSGVLIEGKLRQRRWESEGKKHSKVEIIASAVQFMPRKQAGAEEDAGDIPF